MKSLEREVEFAAIVVMCAREARRIDHELTAIRREAVKLAKRSTELREGMTRLLAMSREAAGHAERLRHEREAGEAKEQRERDGLRCAACGERCGGACEPVRKAG